MPWRRRKIFWTDPFQPKTYVSVLGEKLLEYWHSQQGITLDGSLNVQDWAGRLKGLVLTQTAAGLRPTYGPDGTDFLGKSVVQCANTGTKYLFYDPGSPIFADNIRPAIAYVFRRRSAVPNTTLIDLRLSTGVNSVSDFNQSPTGARRRRVIATSQATNIDLADDQAFAPTLSAVGLTQAGRLQASINNTIVFDVQQPRAFGAVDRFAIGNFVGGGTAADCSFAMVFLLAGMPSQYEQLQIYELARVEWGI